jgi:hypothetical protein
MIGPFALVPGWNVPQTRHLVSRSMASAM